MLRHATRILSKNPIGKFHRRPDQRTHVSNETLVKKSSPPSILILAACLLATVACHRRTAKSQSTAPTETIAPAVAPSSPNGADAMTQTVDVEDSRSEAEGGTVSSTTSTAPKPATLKKVVKGKKK
jgi:hypothetical protein